jgi:hypothetical protein
MPSKRKSGKKSPCGLGRYRSRVTGRFRTSKKGSKKGSRKSGKKSGRKSGKRGRPRMPCPSGKVRDRSTKRCRSKKSKKRSGRKGSRKGSKKSKKGSKRGSKSPGRPYMSAKKTGKVALTLRNCLETMTLDRVRALAKQNYVEGGTKSTMCGKLAKIWTEQKRGVKGKQIVKTAMKHGDEDLSESLANLFSEGGSPREEGKRSTKRHKYFDKSGREI